MERQLQTFRRRFIISVLQFLVAMGFDLLSELEKASMKYLKPAENQISSSNLEQFRAMVKLESSDSSEVENKDILEIGEQTLNNAQNYNFHQSPGNPYQISNFLNNFYINAPLNEAAQPQGAQYQLPPQLQQIQQIPQIQQSQQGQQLLVLQRLPLPFGPNQLSQHVQYRQPVPFPSQNPGQANMLQLAPGGNHYTNPYQQQPYAAPYIPYSNVPTMVDNTPAATTASTSNPLIARYVQTCFAF